MKKQGIILIFLIFFNYINISGKEIFATGTSYPPFQMLENEKELDTKVTGINVDILNLFQLRYPEYKIIYKNYPSGRARNITDNGEVGLDITFTSPTFASKEMLRYFEYAGTFAKTEDKVITMKSKNFIYKEPKDLFGKRVGVIIGYGYGEFDALFESNKIIAERVPTHIINIKKLISGRIDAYFGNIHVSPYYIKELKLNLADFVFSEKNLFEFEYGPYVTKREPELLKDLKEFISNITRSGEIQKIIDKYTK